MRSLPLLACALFACGSPGVVPGDELTALPTTEAEAAAPLPSRCVVTAARADCAHQTLTLTPEDEAREVHWQVPLGDPPSSGWPAVLMFQGSLFSAQRTWGAEKDDAFGALYQTLTVKRLLDQGYAVVTPEAQGDGGTWWDTNQVAWAGNWEPSPDAKLMTAIFEALERGDFGPVDSARLYATGISSGGYMTSRMALSYPGRFRALAIVAASWATCAGLWCAMPERMPDQHPPTLFLHGKADWIVSYSTMVDYEAQLLREGYQTSIVTSESAGHEWLPVAPSEILAWFNAHP